jgi:hypothetical protein
MSSPKHKGKGIERCGVRMRNDRSESAAIKRQVAKGYAEFCKRRGLVDSSITWRLR